jgi:excinuclease ABC subunit A
MKKDVISVKGAKVHNLKNVSVDIPRDALTVITGLSGSGKSSLAFDTIYAEGQRRYVESLSAYARQFLGLMEKPDVEHIEGLSPAISIEQKTTSKNPRSTVATVTEIYDYLRLLYARVGDVFCYSCGKPIKSQTVQEIADTVLYYPEKTKIQILSPIIRGKKGEFRDLFQQIQKEGFVRVRIDGEIQEITDELKLEKNIKHSIEVVVDRLVIKEGISQRLIESLETSLKMGKGLVIIQNASTKEEQLFSEHYACHDCGIQYDEVAPRSFSFNSPFGACQTCGGLGKTSELSEDLLIPEPDKSINDGCFSLFTTGKKNWYFDQLKVVAKHFKILLDKPWKKLSKDHKDIILYGSRGEKMNFTFGNNIRYKSAYEGIVPNLKRRFKQTDSQGIRDMISGFMEDATCTDCNGARLRKESLAVRINNENINDFTSKTISDALEFIENLKLTGNKELIAKQVIKEIRERLYFLNNVGLSYLNLDRASGTLSGGEAQRIRLATQIGSQLMGVLYILDEPSIGLHQRDNTKLLDALMKLRNLGNTVLVVEHDKETIEKADFVIDIGPKAGRHGGEIVALDKPENLQNYEKSITGKYLSGELEISVPSKRRKGNGNFLELKGAKGNNLQNVSIKLPLGTFISITGVSGSGKSTLINATLYPILSQHFYKSKKRPLAYKQILGLEHLDKVIDIDQSPIGRTPRSNPATYTGVFTHIRELFANLNESKLRGYKPGRFSFNVKGGRCEACEGDGMKKIEMHFLPDVYVECEVCKGKRYNRETLEVKYKAYSIADILDMTVEQALEVLENIPSIKNKLKTLYDVGLGYIHLGQPATTLSGGEAQRVKLASELSKRGTGKTLYILDEPTTGLHFDDVQMLLKVLNKLVEKGNTVLVIEHNLDVIKTSDYIIDIGPEGGIGGGKIIAKGTPEQISKNKKSFTGEYLIEELN